MEVHGQLRGWEKGLSRRRGLWLGDLRRGFILDWAPLRKQEKFYFPLIWLKILLSLSEKEGRLHRGYWNNSHSCQQIFCVLQNDTVICLPLRKLSTGLVSPHFRMVTEWPCLMSVSSAVFKSPKREHQRLAARCQISELLSYFSIPVWQRKKQRHGCFRNSSTVTSVKYKPLWLFSFRFQLQIPLISTLTTQCFCICFIL